MKSFYRALGLSSGLACIVILGLFSLGACAPKPIIITRDVPIEVKVPVAQPCVVGTRPSPPLALNKQYSAEQWKGAKRPDPRQKTAIIGSHAIALRTYGENMNGATASCN